MADPRLVKDLEDLLLRQDQYVEDTYALLSSAYENSIRETLTVVRGIVGEIETADDRFAADPLAVARARLALLDTSAPAALWPRWSERLRRIARHPDEYFYAADEQGTATRAEQDIVDELIGLWPGETPGSGLAGRYFSLSQHHRQELANAVTRHVLGRSKPKQLVRELAERTQMSTSQATALFRDSTIQFSRSVQASTAQEQGFEYFKYSGPQDRITRPFCSPLLNKILSRDEIDELDNEQTGAGSVMIAGGGYNCRHRWVPVREEWFSEEEWKEQRGEEEVEVEEEEPPMPEHLVGLKDRTTVTEVKTLSGKRDDRPAPDTLEASDGVLQADDWKPIHVEREEFWEQAIGDRADVAPQYRVKGLPGQTARTRHLQRENEEAWNEILDAKDPNAVGWHISMDGIKIRVLEDGETVERDVFLTTEEVVRMFGVEATDEAALARLIDFDDAMDPLADFMEELRLELINDQIDDQLPSVVMEKGARFEKVEKGGLLTRDEREARRAELEQEIQEDAQDALRLLQPVAMGTRQEKLVKVGKYHLIDNDIITFGFEGPRAWAAPSFHSTSAGWANDDKDVDVSISSGKINVGEHKSREERRSVILHEFGHWVEGRNGRALDASRLFLESRKGSEDLTRIYPDRDEYKDELGWKDDFFDHYVGKNYGNADNPYATEILSMGIQNFSDSTQMAKFYRDDPGHFTHVMNILEGRYGWRPGRDYYRGDVVDRETREVVEAIEEVIDLPGQEKEESNADD